MRCLCPTLWRINTSFVPLKFINMGVNTFFDCLNKRLNWTRCEHTGVLHPAALNGDHPVPDLVFVGLFDGKDRTTAHAIDIRQYYGFAMDGAAHDGYLCVKPVCTSFEHIRGIIDPPNWQKRSGEAYMYIALVTIRSNAYLGSLSWKAKKEIAIR